MFYSIQFYVYLSISTHFFIYLIYVLFNCMYIFLFHHIKYFLEHWYPAVLSIEILFVCSMYIYLFNLYSIYVLRYSNLCILFNLFYLFYVFYSIYSTTSNTSSKVINYAKYNLREIQGKQENHKKVNYDHHPQCP